MLGTAQFGMSYGISNRLGQVSLEEVSGILKYASQCGIDILDTAVAYGNSEGVLGQVGTDGFDIVTKIPSISEIEDINKYVEETVNDSLIRLKKRKLYAILLHRPLELLSEKGQALYSALLTLQQKGIVNKLGISIYEPSDLDKLYSHFPFQIVQAPYNLFDQRMSDSGWFEKLNNDSVEIHTRSVFLQGLLLMNKDERPEGFLQWSENFKLLQEYAEIAESTKLQVALNFVLQNKFISKVLVGVESRHQLQQIVNGVKDIRLQPPGQIKSNDPELINPANWKT